MVPPRDSAQDLLRRLKEIPEGSHVSIILDGENPWDYYPASGRDFLRFVFEGIRQDPALEAVTLSEARDRMPPATLDWLAPGSWAGANFGIWMGHPEDHEAWAMDRARARVALMERKASVLQRISGIRLTKSCWWQKAATGCGGSEMTSPAMTTRYSTRFSAGTSEISIVCWDCRSPMALARPIKKSLGGRAGVMFQGS